MALHIYCVRSEVKERALSFTSLTHLHIITALAENEKASFRFPLACDYNRLREKTQNPAGAGLCAEHCEAIYALTALL